MVEVSRANTFRWLRCFLSRTSMNNIRELDGILDEHGNVVSNNVPIALLGVELDGKTPYIPYSVRGSPRPEYSGKLDKNGGCATSIAEYASR